MESLAHKPQDLVQTRLPTRYGEFVLHYYNLEGKEHLALVLGEVAHRPGVPVRLHSECLTGDVFGSRRCDCGEQLDRALCILAAEGRGVLLYLRQEGRGIGLYKKLQAYNLQDQGMDTVEANLHLGHRADERDYRIAALMLRDLGVDSVRLITNNPVKISELNRLGIQVESRIPIEIPHNPENLRYLQAKADKLSHLLSLRTAGDDFSFLQPLMDRLERHRGDLAGRPFVTLAYAQSVDGSIAVDASHALPLSGGKALRMTHCLRARHDALLVGINTILVDDPRLTVRHCDGTDPQPVVLDHALRFPAEARLLREHPKKPLILTTGAAHAERIAELSALGAQIHILPAGPEPGMVDLPAALALLQDLGLRTLMVEGGACVIQHFLAQRLVDYCIITVAPRLVGGLKAVGEPCQPPGAAPLDIAACGYQVLDEDLIVYGPIRTP